MAPHTAAHGSVTHTIETNRIQLVISGKQNRRSGPYLAAMHRILISLMTCAAALDLSHVPGLLLREPVLNGDQTHMWCK
jgi:hypothetical protein